MPEPRTKFVPPTSNPDDCICGSITPDADLYKLFNCPACDGVYVHLMPTERGQDAD